MDQYLYENHIYEDSDFPIIFHFDSIIKAKHYFPMHWHDSIEILYFISGNALFTCDTRQYSVQTGDIAVVNSNNLHQVDPVSPECTYYCLIVEKSICSDFGIFIDDISFINIINDSAVREYFDMIIQEMLSPKQYYKAAVKSIIISLMIHLCRHYKALGAAHENQDSNLKIDMIKSAISYIKAHYREKLTIDEICHSIGFSKYYLCHNFKQITNKTIVDYINFLRCSYAKILLKSGKYTVSDSCLECGFNNLSYFCKTYKKYMGIVPSKQLHLTLKHN